MRDGVVGMDSARMSPAPALRPDGADGRLTVSQPGPAVTPDAIARAYANTSELRPTDRLKLLRLLIELGGDYLALIVLATAIAAAALWWAWPASTVQMAGPDGLVNP